MRIFLRSIVLPLALVLLDLIALNAAFFSALYLRFHAYQLHVWWKIFGLAYVYLMIATNTIYLVLLLYFKEISFPRRFKPTHVLPRIGKIIAILTLATVMLLFLSKGFSFHQKLYHFSRPTLIVFWVLSFLYISGGRFIVGVMQLALFSRGFLQRRVVLAGEGSPLEDLRHRIKFNRWFGVRPVSTVAVRDGAGRPPEEGTSLLPDSEALRDHILRLRAAEVFLAVPPDDLAQVFAVVEGCRMAGVKLRMVPTHLQLVISHILLSDTIPVQDRTKDDLVYELYQIVDSSFVLDLANVAMIGAKGIPPTFGGIEHHVAQLTSRMATQGFHVSVYSRPYYASTARRFQGVEVVKLPTIYTKHLDAITHTLLASFHIISRRVDVAHYHAQGPAVWSLFPRLFGIRTVVTVHGIDWKREKWGAFARCCLQFGELASARFPTRTITVSRTLRKYYQEKYGRNVHYVPNGIELKEIPPATEITTQFGLESRGFLLFVGRLVPEKGCHYLIDAFRKVKGDMKLVIAGGSSHSDEYVDSLHEAARGDDRIQFLGYVYGEALDELYSHSYVYVHPSDLEGLSIALLEALSFGACVLASDIDENLEVLTDDDMPDEAWNQLPPQEGPPVGYRFRRSDPDDLARMIERLLANPNDVELMRQKSRDWLRSRFNWDDAARQTTDLYLDIIRK